MEGSDNKIIVAGLPASRKSKPRKTNGDKKQKRGNANRFYIRKYGLKNLIEERKLKKQVKALKAEIMIKNARMNYVDRHKSKLQTENNLLKLKLLALTDDKSFKEAECEELKKLKDETKKIING